MSTKTIKLTAVSIVSLLLCIAFAIIMQSNSSAQGKKSRLLNNNCETCHPDVAKKFEDTANVHKQGEMVCADCHGGNSAFDPTPLPAEEAKELAHSVDMGYVGKPSGVRIVELCGNCHSNSEFMRQFSIPTDQLKEYKISGHGKLLYKDPANTDVPTCLTCHAKADSSHLIRFAKKDSESPVHRYNVPQTCGKCHSDESLMGKYKLDSKIVEKYSKSIHGSKLINERDKAVPSCTNCHGTHGALPPAIGTIENTCGHCHSNTMAHYKQSKHYESDAIDKGCIGCHTHHEIQKTSKEMLAKGKGICYDCHSADFVPEGDKFAQNMYAYMTKISAELDNAVELIKLAEQKGFYVHDENHDIGEAKRNYIQALPVVHQFKWKEIEPLLSNISSYIKKAEDSVSLKFRIARDRKIGGIVAFIVALVFISVIYAKFLHVSNRGVK